MMTYDDKASLFEEMKLAYRMQLKYAQDENLEMLEKILQQLLNQVKDLNSKQ
jgi:hypothetical protein